MTSEADIDAVTAISGSGPAYFFLLIDMLAQTAAAFGLEPADAEQDMQTLIARVRSPGGTTAAALDSLEKDRFRAIFERALTAARDRARELGGDA